MAPPDDHDFPPHDDDSYVDLSSSGSHEDGGGYDDGGFDDGEMAIGTSHVPPHDLHAEQAVLGAMMLSDQARYGLTVEDGLKGEDFYAPQHATTFEAIRRLYAENQPVDAITVVEQLRRTGTLDEAGGREAVLQLTSAVTEVAALPRHAQIVQGLSRMRRLLQATYEIQTAVLKGEGDPAIIVEQAQTAVFDVSETEENKGLRSVASFVIFLVAGFVALGRLGVDLAPLLASAGIVGVALGFGSQTLVKDFLSGIFILIEDQYGVGDIVDLDGETSGTVEAVTLRTTRLRRVDGTVWHVPNGEIRRAGNQSQHWSRALLDIEVAYDTDLDRAKEVLQDVADAAAAASSSGPTCGAWRRSAPAA